MRLKHFFASLLAVALLCGCTPRTAEVQTPPVQSPPKPEQAEPTSLPQPPAPPTHATLLAVGDNLIHDVIYWQAKTDDGYDFFPAYQAVAPLIQQADLSFINQETPVVAENPPASYPLFNSPVQLADSLQQLGFDIVNLANNHMLDQHAAGLQSTLSLMQEHFEPQGAVIGVNGAVPVVERNGIRFGFAAFTQHTNGIPLPQDKQEMITYTDQTERMQQQIEQLEQTADLTVVSVHWGEENSTTPTDYQRELAQQLTEWGADLIIGTHPHVLQPVEEITSPNGQPRDGVLLAGQLYLCAGGSSQSGGRDCPNRGGEGPFHRKNHHSSTAAAAGHHLLSERVCATAPASLLRLHRGAWRPTRQPLSRDYIRQLVSSVVDPAFLTGGALD